MEHVSFCPYRTNINYNWSSVQQTEHAPPVTFTATPAVDIIEACKDKEDSEKQAEPIPDEQGMF